MSCGRERRVYKTSANWQWQCTWLIIKICFPVSVAPFDCSVFSLHFFLFRRASHLFNFTPLTLAILRSCARRDIDMNTFSSAFLFLPAQRAIYSLQPQFSAAHPYTFRWFCTRLSCRSFYRKLFASHSIGHWKHSLWNQNSKCMLIVTTVNVHFLYPNAR